MDVEDALGRIVSVPRVPQRVVSLVPSETETIVALVGLGRLVGRTDWCEEPAGRIEAVPCVGGTKNIDVSAVAALAPDLVFANQEENGRRDVEALIGLGVPVFVSFPRTVRDAGAHLEQTARLLRAEAAAQPWLSSLDAAVARAESSTAPRGSALVAIWKDPWMSIDGRTYASDVLRLAGADNVFSTRARRYPLAADLGTAPERPPEARDTRYPRFAIEELRQRNPDKILLPDEPFRFGEAERDELEALGFPGRVVLVSGKDLFWYGVRTAGAIERLTRALAPG